MAKPKKIKKDKSAKASVPCVRIKVGAPRGGATKDGSCTTVGTGVVKGSVDLRREYGTTSKSVEACGVHARGPNKGKPKPCNKPCNTLSKRCPVQLVFAEGQPTLRFCRSKGEPGYVQPISSAAEAVKISGEACRHWAKHKSFDKFFPAGTPLRGPKKRR